MYASCDTVFASCNMRHISSWMQMDWLHLVIRCSHLVIRHIHANTHTYDIYRLASTHTYIRIQNTCMCLCPCPCLCICMRICKCLHIHIYMYVHMYMYIYMIVSGGGYTCVWRRILVYACAQVCDCIRWRVAQHADSPRTIVSSQI